MEELPRMSKWWWLLAGALTVGYVAATALDVSPYLRGPLPRPEGWRWLLRPRNPLAHLGLVDVLLAGGTALTFVAAATFLCTGRGSELRPRIRLAGLILVGAVSWLGLQRLEPLGWAEGIEHHLRSRTYLVDGMLHTPAELWQHFDEPTFHRELVPHTRTKPPGTVLLFSSLFHYLREHPVPAGRIADCAQRVRRELPAVPPPVLATSAVLAFLTWLALILAAIPCYLLGRELGGAGTGLKAAAVFLMVPAAHSFAFQLDAFYPLPAALALYLTVVALRSSPARATFLGLATGLLVGLALFFNFNQLALLVLILLMAGACGLRDDPKQQKAALLFGTVLVTTLLSGGAALLSSGLDPGQVLRLGWLDAHIGYVGHRPWGVWALWNPVAFLLFLGIPASLLLISRIRENLAAAVKERTSALRGNGLAVPFLVFILLLDLSGANRGGEVERLWMLFMPAAVVLAADRLPGPGTPCERISIAVLVGLLVIQVAAFHLIFAI